MRTFELGLHLGLPGGATAHLGTVRPGLGPSEESVADELVEVGAGIQGGIEGVPKFGNVRRESGSRGGIQRRESVEEEEKEKKKQKGHCVPEKLN